MAAIQFQTAKCRFEEVLFRLQAVLLANAATVVLLGGLCCVVVAVVLLGAQNPPTCLSSLCVTSGCWQVLSSDTQLVLGADGLAVIQLIGPFIRILTVLICFILQTSGTTAPGYF